MRACLPDGLRNHIMKPPSGATLVHYGSTPSGDEAAIVSQCRFRPMLSSSCSCPLPIFPLERAGSRRTSGRRWRFRPVRGRRCSHAWRRWLSSRRGPRLRLAWHHRLWRGRPRRRRSPLPPCPLPPPASLRPARTKGGRAVVVEVEVAAAVTASCRPRSCAGSRVSRTEPIRSPPNRRSTPLCRG